MTNKQRIMPLALLALLSASSVLPQVANAQTEGDKQQKQKNDWRNLGAAGAAIAGYGLLKGNTTATLLGAAGAAYSAKRYEDERKSQSETKSAAERARYHRSYTHNGRKYYTYQGHSYYMDPTTGERREIN